MSSIPSATRLGQPQRRLLRWPLRFALALSLALCAAACSDVEEARHEILTGDDDGTIFPDQDTLLSSDTADISEIPDLGGFDEEKPCQSVGGWGCKCNVNSDCASNYCVDDSNGKVCTRYCVGACPTNWTCAAVVIPGSSDLTQVCLPANSNLCKPCHNHSDCATSGTQGESLCIPNETVSGSNKLIDGSFCGVSCTDSECSEGFECTSVSVLAADGITTKTAKQCRPKPDEQGKRECGCTDKWGESVSIDTQCLRTNSYGTCSSTRRCVGAQGQYALSLCTAATPEPEICDGADNDCDGETDEDGATGCTVFYEDNDGDFYGIGVGLCLCGDPGLGYTKNGGDCNDYDSSIKPSAQEICDSKDNNCNGSTDEAGSQGCKIYYADLDGDKFGDDNNSACMCASKKTADYIETPGDCDDGNKNIKPGVPELCDATFDNDCDGKTDEEGAEGCQLWFIDTDKDNYGPTASGKCLCKSAGIYITQNAGDCNDVPTDAVSGVKGVTVNPGAMELCNNIDDDCSGITDDGLASAQCPAVSGGNAACLPGGICGVGKCGNKQFDINEDPSDGCECTADNNYGAKGQSCGNYIDLGDMPDGAGTKFAIGNIVPGEGGDWYHFFGKDLIDTDNGCDAHNVRIKFSSNPGDQYWFDVFRGSCSAGDQICSNETEHSWGTSFYGTMPGNSPGPQGDKSGNRSNYSNAAQHPSGKSPVPEKFGECKCVTAETAGNLLSSPGVNICFDNSAHYFVRVFRKPGAAASCDSYTLRIDNSP